MNKLKITLTVLILTGTIIVSGVVSAQSTNVTMDFTVDSVTEISSCGSVSFPLDFGLNDGQITPPCTITAASNDPDGFYIDISGTSFINGSFIWNKLSTSTGGMDTGCTSNCTEAWGFRIINATASEYSPGAEKDLNNEETSFDSNATTCGTGSEPCWHTVQSSPETIIIDSNSTGAIERSANFDLEFGGVTGSGTTAGIYESTITLEITAN
jgi:hypothetical protein